jgi:CSLREA domain-containing protein
MRANVRGLRAATTFVFLVLLHELLPPALAFTFTVDTQADAFDASPGDGVCASAIGSCTLRAAIDEANALGGNHTILVPSGIHGLTFGQLTILADVTILGTGTAININTPQFWSVIDANHLTRVFHVGVGHSVQIKGVTIRNGRAVVYPCHGGGIRNDGVLTIDDSVIRNNEAGRNISVCSGSGVGGGIFNSESGVLTLTRSLVRDNFTNGTGGSIANWGGTAVAFDSTIDAGSALFYGIANFHGSLFAIGGSTVQDHDGGIAQINADSDSVMAIVSSTIRRGTQTGVQNAGLMTMKTSTVSQNRYGAISNYSPGQLAMENSTISGNGSIAVRNGSSGPATPFLFALNVTITNNVSNAPYAQAVGIRTDGNAVTALINTIVAGNHPGDCQGTQLSLGHNIDGDGSCGLTSAGDLSGVNPVLAPLANNGGPTETHLPLVFSPVLSAGNAAACPTTDQRGITRPQASCDIGAVEVMGTPGQLSDLHLHIPEKPDPDTIPPGPDPVAYRLLVTNRAEQGQGDDVTLHIRVHGGRLLAAKPTRGTCQVVVPNGREANAPPNAILTCRVGDLPDGDGASVHLEIARPDPGDSHSIVVVSGVALSDISDLQPHDNVAAAVTRFRR